MKKIVVIGQGYMGFPMSLILAKSGYKVTGFDIDKRKVERISSGKVPFQEPGLKDLFEEVKANFTNHYRVTSSIEPADIFIISVPTPKKGHKADMSFVNLAASSIAKVLKDGNLVILESTSPPGSTIKLGKQFFGRTKKKYYLAYCPERAFPGKTIHELVYNDRIVGGIDEESSLKAAHVYESFSKAHVIKTDSLTAEVTKLVENSYRDVNIAFANELVLLGNELGFNAREVIGLANLHPRVSILNPGPGVGGHCIPIDPWFLVEKTKQGKLIRSARKINDQMPLKVVKLLPSLFGTNLGTIGVLGLSYKEDVDDYRESPSLEIIHNLKKEGGKYLVSDPYVKELPDTKISELSEVLSKAKTIVIATGHSAYSQINFNKYPNIKYVLDTRGVIPISKINSIHANVETL